MVKRIVVTLAAAVAVVLPASGAAAVPSVSGRLYHTSVAPGPCTLKAPALYSTASVSISSSFNWPWFISQSFAWSSIVSGQTGTKAYNVYHYSVDKRYGGCEYINGAYRWTQYWFATTPTTDCYRMSYAAGILIATGWGRGRC